MSFDLTKYIEEQNKINIVVENNMSAISNSNSRNVEAITFLSTAFNEINTNINKIKNELDIVKKENENLQLKQNNTDNQLTEIKNETDNITKTLMTNGTEKRSLEKYIHNLIYKEIGKNTLRDELFHGYLTKSCKAHINNSLGISKFDWIKIDEINTVKNLACRFLTANNIHKLMRKESNRLAVKFDVCDRDNKKTLSDVACRKSLLLDKLLDGVQGDTSLI